MLRRSSTGSAWQTVDTRTLGFWIAGGAKSYTTTVPSRWSDIKIITKGRTSRHLVYDGISETTPNNWYN
jgi:hypothetical protein